MREIKRLVLHMAYTRPSMDIGVKEITEWHNARGFNGCGYHWVIRRSGELEKGRDESVSGAHVAGHNSDSVGICLVGGRKENEDKADCNFTLNQWNTLRSLLYDLLSKYPNAEICGHRDLANRECPGFDATVLMEK